MLFGLFGLLLLAALAIPVRLIVLKREKRFQEALREGFHPQFAVDCKPGEDGIRTFVETHLGQIITSLEIRYISNADQASFSQLKQLTSLRSLTLSGMWSAPPVRSGGSEEFVFGPVLTEKAVQALSEIETLRHVWIWYGSLSGAQKSVIRLRNPECEFHENLNKL